MGTPRDEAPLGPDPARIRAMFGGIAPRYDLLNRVLSGNLDRLWRRAAARSIPGGTAARVLDLCGGTGDLSVEIARQDQRSVVVCCDFSHPMLSLAGQKFARERVADRCLRLEADGLRLPFADGIFDAVTVAFGVRNLADLTGGLREIRRVLRSGGRLVVLEFSRPSGRLVGPLYRFYLKHVLPFVGGGITGQRGAYGYLAQSISQFPDPQGLARVIRESGFDACDFRLLCGGIVAIHVALR